MRIDALDVANPQAMEKLFADLAQRMPPLAGVMHAAMVLDDVIVANMDETRLVKVLRPKILGADNLDRLTRGRSLDYFVLFSSATAMIGNPGQAAYVAANGYLEGVARQRHSEGLPALAVSWGAIADVGVLARHSAIRDTLAHRAGVRGMKAKTALDLMAQALSYEGGPGGDSVVAIADMNWSAARANLTLLNSASYNWLAVDDQASEISSAAVIDLRSLTSRLGTDQARRAVADILVEEIARILRLPRENVSRTKPLAEIGLELADGGRTDAEVLRRASPWMPRSELPQAASMSETLRATSCPRAFVTTLPRLARIWRSGTWTIGRKSRL